MTPSQPARAIAAPPRVTAVVVRSGSFEATIGTDKGISISRVGPRDGRQHIATLTASEASSLLGLVEHGRAALVSMSEP